MPSTEPENAQNARAFTYDAAAFFRRTVTQSFIHECRGLIRIEYVKLAHCPLANFRRGIVKRLRDPFERSRDFWLLKIAAPAR